MINIPITAAEIRAQGIDPAAFTTLNHRIARALAMRIVLARPAYRRNLDNMRLGMLTTGNPNVTIVMEN